MSVSTRHASSRGGARRSRTASSVSIYLPARGWTFAAGPLIHPGLGLVFSAILVAFGAFPYLFALAALRTGILAPSWLGAVRTRLTHRGAALWIQQLMVLVEASVTPFEASACGGPRDETP